MFASRSWTTLGPTSSFRWLGPDLAGEIRLQLLREAPHAWDSKWGRRGAWCRSPSSISHLESSITTHADELIVASAIYDHERRLRSYELLAEAVR